MRSISRRRPSTSTARKTTVAVGLGGLDQLLDLGFGQVFPLAISRIRLPARRNCSLLSVGITSARCDFARICRLHPMTIARIKRQKRAVKSKRRGNSVYPPYRPQILGDRTTRPGGRAMFQ